MLFRSDFFKFSQCASFLLPAKTEFWDLIYWVEVLFFLCYNRFQDFIQTAGAIGGAISSLVRVPTEVVILILLLSFSCFLSVLKKLSTFQVVKQRMQTGQFTSAPNAVRLIVTTEGFKGLYAVCDTYGVFILKKLLQFSRKVFKMKIENRNLCLQ